MNVLLIEDEVNVSNFIKKGLEENAFQVTAAYDGPTGLALARENTYDVIVLDIILPLMNGWEICAQLRNTLKLNTPVLMLSALSTTQHIVQGLNDGADDYLAKPFKMEELIARLHSLHRRHQGYGLVKNRLVISNLIVDMDTKEVFRDDQKIKLTAKEFHLLEYFIKNQNKVLSRDQILDNVWGIDFDIGTNVVDVYVNYLRKKIDKDFEPKLIHTVVGMGYIFKVA
ncbi:MAG: response regulator transcription factor [Bacteroidia bacterium]|nr:response regulator transcription factor [Bacteroidia bacterium]